MQDLLQGVPGNDGGTDASGISDIGGSGVGRAEQAAITQITQAQGLDDRLAIVAYRLGETDLGGGAEVGTADDAGPQHLLDAPRALHAGEDGPYHGVNGQVRAIRQRLAREEVELIEGLDQFHLRATGIDGQVGDVGKGPVQRQ